MAKELMAGAILAIVGALAGAIASYLIFRPSPVAFARCQPTVGSAPLTVRCANEGNYFAHSVWEIGEDGAPVRKDEQQIEHTFQSPGSYRITLTLHGNGSNTSAQTIVVSAASALPSREVVTVVAQLRENRVLQTRQVPISRTKDDHPSTFSEHSRQYTETFSATPGFKIVSADLHKTSATRESDIRLHPSPTGDSLTVSFRLTSGPAVDRYRGWLRGALEIREEKVEPASEIVLADGLSIALAGTYPLERSVALDSIRSIRIQDAQQRLIASGAPEDVLIGRDGALAFSVTQDAGQALLRVERAN